jgi:hypothetical protein
MISLRKQIKQYKPLLYEREAMKIEEMGDPP